MKMIERLWVILLWLGILIIGLIQIVSIGYGLYLWGGEGLAFGVSVWSAFKLWMTGMGTGIVLALIGHFMND